MPAVTEPPGLLMYSQMSAFAVLALEVQQLGADLVGDVVVDVGPEHHDPVLEQPGEDVGVRRTASVESEGDRGISHAARLPPSVT